MGLPQAREATEVTVRERWVIHYEISGDLRYISHHDTLRLFQRAFARAAFPIRYSAGFNPHPRMSIPLPRPVGIASACEVIVVECCESVAGESLRDNLAAQMPAGLTVRAVERLAEGERWRPDRVRYRLEFDIRDREWLGQRIAEVLAASHWPVMRSDEKGAVREVDIRPYLVELEPAEAGVEFTLRVTGQGTAKPSEIAGLLALEQKCINHRITRLHVTWARTGKSNDDDVHDEQ
jgi:radical SAM-linked protein